ncbi:MAG: DUF192 domain-containing protein [Aggregatilineales bacterium]
MKHYRVVRNTRTGEIVLPRAEWRANYWGHLTGLMFRRHLPDDEGLLFAYGRESVLETAIHMLFMFFPIATVWLDKNGVVVDKTLAKPWRLSYAPRKPAQFFIEARPLVLDRVAIGDPLRFDESA